MIKLSKEDIYFTLGIGFEKKGLWQFEEDLIFFTGLVFYFGIYTLRIGKFYKGALQ